jgi:signal transduction histidine kinase
MFTNSAIQDAVDDLNDGDVTEERMATYRQDFDDELVSFRQVVGESFGLESVRMLGVGGTVLLSTAPSEEGTDMSSDSRFQRGIREGFLEFAQIDGQRKAVVAVPVYRYGQTGESEPIGAAIVTMRTDKFDEILLNREGLGQTGEVYMVNENRMLISESRFIEDAAFRTTVDTLAVDECFGSRQEIFAVYPDYRDIPIVGSSYCASDLGFVLLAEIDEAEIFQPVTQMRDAILAAAIVITGVVVTIAVYVSRTISKPLVQLKDAADRISQGDYSHKVELHAGDEVGQLAARFDMMRKSVLETNMNLNRLVKEQVEELNRANEELREKDKLKDEFLSMASHELKTPLTPIIGWTGALKSSAILGTLTPDQRAAVDTIEKNAIKLEKMISDLLDAQKLELGEFKFNIGQVDVDRIVRNVERDFEFVMKEKDIKFVLDVGQGLKLESDELRIMQVIGALLYNSVDFVPKAGGRIELSARRQDSEIVFGVKDNGPGIPKDKQQFLFKKFYQLDTSLKRKHGGTGLGLAISKGIVTGLGGRIWVDTEESKGSSFYFALPREPKNEDPHS